MVEAVTRVIAEAGAGRTAIRLSPNGDSQGTNDSDPLSVFVPAAKALADLNIAFLELREIGANDSFGSTDVPKLGPDIRKVFPGPLVLNQEYTLATAQAALASGVADAISWGRLFIANPDLPARLKAQADLNKPNPRTFYTPGPEGYIDYPALS